MAVKKWEAYTKEKKAKPVIHDKYKNKHKTKRNKREFEEYLIKVCSLLCQRSGSLASPSSNRGLDGQVLGPTIW